MIAYHLHCHRCGLAYPLENTDENERCACGGQLNLASADDGAVVLELAAAPIPVERHETVRLFEPAPNQIAGQLAF
jgi:hypothetical protein